MLRGLCAVGAALLLGAPADAAVLVQWKGHARTFDDLIHVSVSRNLANDPPSLIDGALFVVDIYVTGPADLGVFGQGAYRTNDYFDGVPTGGGTGYFDLATTQVVPGHWTAAFTSVNKTPQPTPGFYQNTKSALVGAEIRRRPGAEFDYRITLSSTNPLAIEVFSHLFSVPEPATWAMMIAGFGMAGAAMRRSRTARASFASA